MLQLDWECFQMYDIRFVLEGICSLCSDTLSGSISVVIQYSSDTAMLIVSDTGVGIPRADIDRIGERFHRVFVSFIRGVY